MPSQQSDHICKWSSAQISLFKLKLKSEIEKLLKNTVNIQFSNFTAQEAITLHPKAHLCCFPRYQQLNAQIHGSDVIIYMQITCLGHRYQTNSVEAKKAAEKFQHGTSLNRHGHRVHFERYTITHSVVLVVKQLCRGELVMTHLRQLLLRLAVTVTTTRCWI